VRIGLRRGIERLKTGEKATSWAEFDPGLVLKVAKPGVDAFSAWIAYSLDRLGENRDGEVESLVPGGVGQKQAPAREGPSFSVARPLVGAQVVTLAKAATDLSVSQLPLPSSSVNSSIGSVTEARDTSDSGQVATFVAVSYPQAGLVVEYESPVPYPDAAQYYSTYVEQTPQNLAGLASVGSVAGAPALVLQENKGATGSNPASIEFVHGGLKVAVIGYQSAAALMPVATAVANN
jgi:hypothetical protein